MDEKKKWYYVFYVTVDWDDEDELDETLAYNYMN